jgi:cytoskeletal protein RodZ
MATLGQQLKQSREEKGVSLHEIAESTHIGVRFLQAIENDAYDVLPGGVFNRAFVRKFAKEVGFDEEQAVNLYEEQLEEQGGEPERSYQLGVEEFETRPTSGNGLLLSFVALIILGALAYAAYQYFTPASSETERTALSGVSSPTPTPAATETPAPSVSPDASASPAASPAESPAASPTASPGPSPTPGTASTDAIHVQLAAPTEEVWLSVKPDGKEAERMILKTGEAREYDVSEKIVLSIGRVQSLKIAINGRNMDFVRLLPNPKATRASNVVINKDNYQQYLN